MLNESNGAGVCDALHQEIQSVLQRVDEQLRAEIADLKVASGRTSGTAFLLHSYRTYSASGSDFEPIVVGVTIRREGERVVIRGDVSGESSGDILFETGPASCLPRPDEMVQTARDVADRLSSATRWRGFLEHHVARTSS